ncbi:MarR family transcriptional regulator [Streptomyces sp. NBC_01304]|uniref:MarR family transcriptional regulator n=1 Tax=Streptomyces sp. NBC_01304 TaxID=2903818 RepID=UPI002E0FB46F|nr:MarR family transcriptional regulator [Streptomyces sp. NBC_01304]
MASAESPGAPGLETLLLRSGRVSEADWAEALEASRGTRRPAAELITLGRVGAVELQVIWMMAMYDAVFALLAGTVDECVTRVDECVPRAQDGGPPTPDGPAERPLPLVREAVRRLEALARLPHPVRPDTDPLLPGPRPDALPDRLPGVQREILGLADGRRTPRDIAFQAGRGVYTVTVGASRLLAEGFLVRAPAREAASAREGAPADSPAPADALPLRRRVRQEEPAPDVTASGLPRRSPGAGGPSETLAEENSTASWKGIFRLGGRLRPTGFGK